MTKTEEKYMNMLNEHEFERVFTKAALNKTRNNEHLFSWIREFKKLLKSLGKKEGFDNYLLHAHFQLYELREEIEKDGDVMMIAWVIDRIFGNKSKEKPIEENGSEHNEKLTTIKYLKKFDGPQLAEIITAIDNNLDTMQIYDLMNENFNNDKIRAIRVGYELNLNETFMRILKDERYQGYLSLTLLIAMQNGMSKKNILFALINSRFREVELLDEILTDLSERRKWFAELYLKYGLSGYVISTLRAFTKSISKEDIEYIVKLKVDDEAIYMIASDISIGEDIGMTRDKIDFYVNTKFDYDRMNEIREGLYRGLSIDEVKTYAKEEYTAQQMKEMRIKMETDQNFCVPDKIEKKIKPECMNILLK